MTTFYIDRFQGDPYLYLTNDGAAMRFSGGQPIMDGGLENAVFLSLFTSPGWYGNTFLDAPNQKVGSDFVEIASETFTLANLQRIGGSAERALQWLIDLGVCSNIEAVASNPTGQMLEVTILIQPAGADVLILLLKRYDLNWTIQKIDPAHLRL